jgi:hypothetical protein
LRRASNVVVMVMTRDVVVDFRDANCCRYEMGRSQKFRIPSSNKTTSPKGEISTVTLTDIDEVQLQFSIRLTKTGCDGHGQQ